MGTNWKAEYESLLQVFSDTSDRLDVAVEALEQISNWAKAYPLDVFPEPDFRYVREVLRGGGISLDAVSASNMRHVITGVSKIVNDALEKLSE